MDVLIVDDNELNGRALRRALQRLHAVRVVTTVADALAELRTRRPDVVLCDFELGDENATAFLRQVTTEFPGVRRVLYSASRPELWSELVEDKLIDIALSKPASTEAILASIDKA